MLAALPRQAALGRVPRPPREARLCLLCVVYAEVGHDLLWLVRTRGHLDLHAVACALAEHLALPVTAATVYPRFPGTATSEFMAQVRVEPGGIDRMFALSRHERGLLIGPAGTRCSPTRTPGPLSAGPPLAP